jgi:lactate racemase
MILSEAKVREIMKTGIPAGLYQNRRVLVLTPDGTRSCPLPMMVRILRETIGERATRLDFMVALGTHPIMTDDEILRLYGIDTAAGTKSSFGKSSFFCHRWDDPSTFKRIGELTVEEVATISGGLLREQVPIDINRHIFDYDQIIILGPVFPHEVVGFSGGPSTCSPVSPEANSSTSSTGWGR